MLNLQPSRSYNIKIRKIGKQDAVPDFGLKLYLGDAVLPEVVDVPLLVAPLDPAGRGDERVDEDEGVEALGVLQGVPDEHVGAQADAEADVAHHGEVVDGVVNL